MENNIFEDNCKKDGRTVVAIGMSCTLIHHGHIRLIKKVKNIHPDCKLVILLTTDEEIISHKGYIPELGYSERKEILESIIGVDEVIPSTWSINDELLSKYNIEIFVNGPDNDDPVIEHPVLKVPRTSGISSTELRTASLESRIMKMNSDNLYYTPGPGNLYPSVLNDITPIFSRGDDKYSKVMNEFNELITDITGLPNTVALQGSSTLAIEIAMLNFIPKDAKVLLINTGFYSDRLYSILKNHGYTKLDTETPESLTRKILNKHDWIIGSYVETSKAYKLGDDVTRLLSETNAHVFMDATASVGLEGDHQFADVIAFSSVKGLFGLTGASFIQYNNNVSIIDNTNSFYLDIRTHIEKKVTTPIHIIQSMLPAMRHNEYIVKMIKAGRDRLLAKCTTKFYDDNQPLICSLIADTCVPLLKEGVMYSPRVKYYDDYVIVNNLHNACFSTGGIQ